MTESRLDAALAFRGLARSRTHAAKLISEGSVTVDGIFAIKPSTKVEDHSVLVVASTDHYVSRGAHKLIAALDAFAVKPQDRPALDVGASTGGFTQVLLERGARRVIAVDVGHGQLAPEIEKDERVISVEGYNARYMSAESLTTATEIEETVSLVVGDLSFISLTTVMPALVQTAADDADMILLVKPQFEVGRSGIREGIVHRAALREDAVSAVLWSAWDHGIGTAGAIPSPIAGSHGNHEYLVWLSSRHGSHPTEWLRQISTMVGA